MMVCLLDAHRERPDLRYETPLMTMPEIATSTYLDKFGNTVRRFIAPAGDLTLSRDAVIEDSGVPDAPSRRTPRKFPSSNPAPPSSPMQNARASAAISPSWLWRSVAA